MVLTSPPYFGLRDYKHPGQIGREKKPEQFVSALVEAFRQARTPLADDGTLWINLGDSYGPDGNLLGIPWKVAFALQDDGWILRQEIIWAKLSPMPESVADRCTRAHESVFVFAKNRKYFYDWEAIATPHAERTLDRWGKGGLVAKKTRHKKGETAVGGLRNGSNPLRDAGANRTSVWTIRTESNNSLAHLAMMPRELATLCIRAGCPDGGTVLDPFGGAGTTGLVGGLLGRNAILCELNPEYAALSSSWLRSENMFSEIFLETHGHHS